MLFVVLAAGTSVWLLTKAGPTRQAVVKQAVVEFHFDRPGDQWEKRHSHVYVLSESEARLRLTIPLRQYSDERSIWLVFESPVELGTASPLVEAGVIFFGRGAAHLVEGTIVVEAIDPTPQGSFEALLESGSGPSRVKIRGHFGPVAQ